MSINKIEMTTTASSPSKIWEVKYIVDQAGTAKADLITSGTFLDRNIGIEIVTPSTTVIQGVTTIKNNTVTRGKTTWENGFVKQGTINAVTFSNIPATGKQDNSYIDISNTTEAPMLSTSGYLYINQGYTDNLKISLAKLIPDWSTTWVATDNHILKGYQAYDQDGQILTGTIESINSINFSGGGFSDTKATAAFSNLTANTTTNNGIKIITYGNAKRTAINYATTTNGYINFAAGTKAIDPIGSTTWTGNTYYITGITVPNSTTAFTLETAAGFSGQTEDFNPVNITNNVRRTLNITAAGGGWIHINHSSQAGTDRITAFSKVINTENDYLAATAIVVKSGKWVTTAVTPNVSAMSGPFYGEVYVKSMSTGTKANGQVDLTNANTITPVLTKLNTPTGVINAANADATSTTPTSGVYVAVKSNASTAVLTAKANITKSGYVEANAVWKTTTATIGAIESKIHYIKIKSVEPTFSGGAVTGNISEITATNCVLSSNNNGISVKAIGSANRSNILYNAVSGWVEKAANTIASTAPTSATSFDETMYIESITVPKDKPFSISTNADTALDTTSNLTITNGAFRNANISNSGSVTITSGSKTAGNLTVSAYALATSTNPTSKQIVSNGVWITPQVSGVGTYYGRTVISAGTAAAGAASVDNITNDGNNAGVNIAGILTGTKTTTEPNNGYYIAFKGSGNSKVTKAGWFETGDLTGAETSITYFPVTTATVQIRSGNSLNPSANINTTQATLVNTNNSGIVIKALGGSSFYATVEAITNKAGYAPLNTKLGSAVLDIPEETTEITKYLKEVELIKPSSGSREFGVKVPNGNSTITFVFHVDNQGNVTVDNEYSLTY